jgi:hypothetical protein
VAPCTPGNGHVDFVSSAFGLCDHHSVVNPGTSAEAISNSPQPVNLSRSGSSVLVRPRQEAQSLSCRVSEYLKAKRQVESVNAALVGDEFAEGPGGEVAVAGASFRSAITALGIGGRGFALHLSPT